MTRRVLLAVQVLLLLNLIALVTLQIISGQWNQAVGESIHIFAAKSVLLPLNILWGLLVILLARARDKASSWSELQQVSVVPVEPEGDQGAQTPVEELMQELMQTAVSLCSAAPEQCRGLLMQCSRAEHQAVHVLGNMVRSHLFPLLQSDGESHMRNCLGSTQADSRISTSLLSNAVNTFLFGDSSLVRSPESDFSPSSQNAKTASTTSLVETLSPVGEFPEDRQTSCKTEEPDSITTSKLSCGTTRRNSADSEFSATSCTDFNLKRSQYRADPVTLLPNTNAVGSLESRYEEDQAVHVWGQDALHKGTSNRSSKSSNSGIAVRCLVNRVAAHPAVEIGQLSYGRDGCALRRYEMDQERQESIALAKRYEAGSPRHPDVNPQHAFSSESTAPEQELLAACQRAVFPQRHSLLDIPNLQKKEPYDGSGGRKQRSFSVTVNNVDSKPQDGRGGKKQRSFSVSVSNVDSESSAMVRCHSAGGSPSPPSHHNSHTQARRPSATSSTCNSRNRSRKPSISALSHGTSGSAASIATSHTEGSFLGSIGFRRLSKLSRNSRRSSTEPNTIPEMFKAGLGLLNGQTSKPTSRRSSRNNSRTSSIMLAVSNAAASIIKSNGSKPSSVMRLKRLGLPEEVQQLILDYGSRSEELLAQWPLGYKNAENLVSDLESGRCRFESLKDRNKVMRVVAVAALRITAPAVEHIGKEVLTLVHKWHRHRKGAWFRRNALPGTTLREQEQPRAAAERLITADFPGVAQYLEIQPDVPLETVVDERISPSFPGVLTRYEISIVSVQIRPETDAKSLALFGLGPECPQHLRGSLLLHRQETGQYIYDWETTCQCQRQGISLQGSKDNMTLAAVIEEGIGHGDHQKENIDDYQHHRLASTEQSNACRAVREALAEAPTLQLKDLLRHRMELLDLSLEDLARALTLQSAQFPSYWSRPGQQEPGRAVESQLATNIHAAQLPDDSPMASLLAHLPKSGSLFTILAKMCHMSPETSSAIAQLDSASEQAQDDSDCTSELSVSTTVLWQMAMQDCDSITDIDNRIKDVVSEFTHGHSSKPCTAEALISSDNMIFCDLDAINESVHPHTCELAVSSIAEDDSPSNGVAVHPTPGTVTLALAGSTSLDQQIAPTIDVPKLVVTVTSADTSLSEASVVETPEQLREDRMKRYAERKARRKAAKEISQTGKVTYGEILRNSHEQCIHDSQSCEISSADNGATALTVPASQIVATAQNICPTLSGQCSGGDLEQAVANSDIGQKQDGTSGIFASESIVSPARQAAPLMSIVPLEAGSTADAKEKWNERRQRKRMEASKRTTPTYGALLRRQNSPRAAENSFGKTYSAPSCQRSDCEETPAFTVNPRGSWSPDSKLQLSLLQPSLSFPTSRIVTRQWRGNALETIHSSQTTPCDSRSESKESNRDPHRDE